MKKVAKNRVKSGYFRVFLLQNILKGLKINALKFVTFVTLNKIAIFNIEYTIISYIFVTKYNIKSVTLCKSKF